MKKLNKRLRSVLKVVRILFAIYMVGFAIWYFQDDLLPIWENFLAYCADVLHWINNIWISFFQNINNREIPY